MKEQFQKEANELKEGVELQKKELAEGHTKQQQEFDQKVEELQTQLAELLEFKETKETTDAKMEELQQQNETLQSDTVEQRNELERRLVETTSRMKKEHEQKLAELKLKAEEEVGNGQSPIGGKGARRRQRTSDKIGQVDLETGYAKRSANQQREVRDAQQKVRSLESALQQLVRDFEHEKLRLEKVFKEQLEKSTAGNDGLARSLKLKIWESKNIKRLAQDVLHQRSNIETFLLSSLEQIQREIEAENSNSNQGKNNDEEEMVGLEGKAQVDRGIEDVF